MGIPPHRKNRAGFEAAEIHEPINSLGKVNALAKTDRAQVAGPASGASVLELPSAMGIPSYLD